MTQQCNWPGTANKKYTFNINHMGDNWKPVPGVYIFAKQLSNGRWQALYIGEAQNLKTRLTPNHGEWTKAVRRGATHVHARRIDGGLRVRKVVEKDLIRQIHPPLNQHHNPLAQALTDFAR